jgi:hypothetical protein
MELQVFPHLAMAMQDLLPEEEAGEVLEVLERAVKEVMEELFFHMSSHQLPLYLYQLTQHP